MGFVCAIDICFALSIHHTVYLEAHYTRNKLQWKTKAAWSMSLILELSAWGQIRIWNKNQHVRVTCECASSAGMTPRIEAITRTSTQKARVTEKVKYWFRIKIIFKGESALTIRSTYCSYKQCCYYNLNTFPSIVTVVQLFS